MFEEEHAVERCKEVTCSIGTGIIERIATLEAHQKFQKERLDEIKKMLNWIFGSIIIIIIGGIGSLVTKVFS